jgi:hypothetical protein
MRTLLLEIGGSVALVVGAAQIDTALGWLAGGVLALVAAWRSAQ